jgi:NosR/NirI family nitrous oxide reductase transcriptional regulator
MGARAWIASLFDKSFDPARVRLPELDAAGQTSVPGLYIIGDLAGTPLLKNAINMGHRFVEASVGEVKGKAPAGGHDLVIIGAGAAGLAAALQAKRRGLSYVVIEQGEVGDLVRNMTRGKVLFAEPENVPKEGELWFEECTREVLLERWNEQVAREELAIRTREPVVDVRREDGHLAVVTPKGTYTAARVALAIGRAGNPRRIGCPGEDRDRIAHRLRDPEDLRGMRVLVYGGGDVACEAAVALAGVAKVTQVTIDERWLFPRKRNADAVDARVASGAMERHFGTRVARIEDRAVTLRHPDGREETLANDHVLTMIGADLPQAFFDRVGIRVQGTWTGRTWAAIAAMFLLCYAVYAVKAPWWPFNRPFLGAASVKEWLTFDWTLGGFTKRVSPGFWYSLAYTLFVTFFGLRAVKRWGRDPHQRKRYASIIGFQWTFFFLIPEFLFWWIHQSLYVARPEIARAWLGGPENYWRSYGLVYAFPLQFHQFYYENPGLFYVLWGALLAVVLVPLFAVFQGKRYCTWICGCGGLAETFGDAWRDKAPKGRVSQRWEFMNRVVLAWSLLALALAVGEALLRAAGIGRVAALSGTAGAVRSAYAYFCDFWLVGVIPVALYPFLGGKIWCRYWCPLAKIMEYVSAWSDRLRITANDKCISCGECNRYCQVGIDVMRFAKDAASFGNKETSCIHCGICITACPMTVLKFERKPKSP